MLTMRLRGWFVVLSSFRIGADSNRGSGLASSWLGRGYVAFIHVPSRVSFLARGALLARESSSLLSTRTGYCPSYCLFNRSSLLLY
ncbi:hypothetical protein DAEQUDRAFT_88031 [Daedalea quercina L-15889]|uniref:Uncharacterized protein n=1 Tax=Daedalea quercina L-15889 TaxID=1314783 RepID=A0A165KZ14_9APHY|nr:hypothetical protein DAEQUDRAFT_88031 [Daedalea quercina L-15889]